MGTDIEIIKNRLDQFGRDLTTGQAPLDQAMRSAIVADLRALATEGPPRAYDYYRAALGTVGGLEAYLTSRGLSLRASALRFASNTPGSPTYNDAPNWKLLARRLMELPDTMPFELHAWIESCADLIRSHLPDDWLSEDVQIAGQYDATYGGYMAGLYRAFFTETTVPLAIRLSDNKPTAALFMTKRGGLRELRKEASIALDAVTSAAPEAQHTHANPRWTVSRLITSRRSVRPAGRAAESMTRRIVK